MSQESTCQVQISAPDTGGSYALGAGWCTRRTSLTPGEPLPALFETRFQRFLLSFDYKYLILRDKL